MEKKAYLSRGDILRIRSAVDRDFAADVDALCGDTTDDLSPIAVPKPLAKADNAQVSDNAGKKRDESQNCL